MKGQSLLLGYQVTMSGETVWQGLAAILPIFHWTVLSLRLSGDTKTDPPGETKTDPS